MISLRMFTYQRIIALLTIGRGHLVRERDLLEGTGLRLQDLARSEIDLTHDHEMIVIRNLQAALPPQTPLPLEAGLHFYLTEVGTLGEAVRTAASVGEALAFAVSYLDRSHSSTFRMSATTEGPILQLWFDASDAPADVRTFVTIRSMVRVAMAAQELVGTSATVLGVSVAAPEPAYGSAIEDFAGVPIEWGAQRSGVQTELALLARPLDDDPVRHARAVERCWELQEKYAGPNTMAARVRASLATGQITSAAGVARELMMSERTLRRGLAAEGTTFRELAAHVARERAYSLLQQGLSAEQTARRLGYSDGSTFARAFKRWTGSTPEVWWGSHR